MRLIIYKMKIKNLRLKITASAFVFVLSFVFCAFNLNIAYAQEIRSYTVSPATVEKELSPGQSAEGVLKVINNSPETLNFEVTLRDFVVDDTIGTPNILPPNTLSPKFSAASWVGVYPSSFTVEPNSKATFNYYIQVPKDARPGGHYAAIVYNPVTNTTLNRTGASVQTQIGTLIYISVSGNIKENSLVSNFLTDWLHEFGPINIFTRITNLGDLHIRPSGVIKITDLLGRTTTQKLEEFNIFPSASRDYRNTVGDNLMIGPYKATLIASYGKNNNLPLTATVTFIVFPWRMALLVILIIIAIFLGVKLWKKKQLKSTDNTPKTEEK